MTILLMLITIIPLSFASTPETNLAKKSIEGLIRPLLLSKQNKGKPGPHDFRLDECEKYKVKWMDVLLQKSTLSLDYRMKPGCDIEGTIVPKIFSQFSVSLKVRNLQEYTLLEAKNQLNAGLETKPLLYLEVREASLTGPGKSIKFEADYQVQINPLNEKNQLEKNLGGEVRISEIDGKKVSYKEKILIK